MIDAFKYGNSRQQSQHSRVEYVPPYAGSDKDGTFEESRDELLSKYGWVSPYEFYYGTDTTSVDTDNNTVIDFDYIERLGQNTDDDVVVADRRNVPNYFWCESLSNWCYFKTSAVIPTYEHRDSWAPGWLRSIAAIATVGGTEILEEISVNGFNWDLIWRAPLHIVSSTASGLTGLGMEAVAMVNGGRTMQERYGAITLPFLIYNAISGSSKSKTSDGEAEVWVETFTPNPGEILMPRMCISLYMWNGYKRTWIPVKNLIDDLTRLVRPNSVSLNQMNIKNEFVNKVLKDHGTWRTGSALEEGITDWIKVNNLSEDSARAFRDCCNEYAGDDTKIGLLVYNLSSITMSDPKYNSNMIGLANTSTIQNYYLDCTAFEPLVGRTPLSKLQYIGIDNGDEHGWGEHHYIEQWGFWIPLPKDNAKIKLFAKDTFQLFNRQYYYISYDKRDHQGWIHKNLGHPCFFRGNDNELWMSYWLRWTSGNGSEKKSGWMWSETTKMSGEYDISKDDVSLWDDILSTMFEKHDDYGYDEWLVNGEYGLTYEKFTVNEEVPSEILTADESTMNPDKAPLVNSIEETQENTMILSLSSGTVISRDDDNSILNTADRWK